MKNKLHVREQNPLTNFKLRDAYMNVYLKIALGKYNLFIKFSFNNFSNMPLAIIFR